jgi:hypothetical protein
LGEYKANFSHVYDLKKIAKYHYTYFKTPIILTSMKDKSFSTKQLTSPLAVISALTIADSKIWSDNLFEDPKNNFLNEKNYSSRKTTDFFKNYTTEVLADFKFVYNNQQYDILLLFTNSFKGTNEITAFVLHQTSNQWKISSDKDLMAFASFMYLKPELFRLFLTHNYSAELYPQIGNKLWYNNTFFIDTDFLFNAINLYYMEKKSYLDAALPFDEKYQVDHNVFVNYDFKTDEYMNGSEVILSCKSNISNIMLFNYDKVKAQNNLWFLSEDINRVGNYDSLPEVALVSWLFARSIEEKKSNSIGFSFIEEQSRKYIDEGAITSRIDLQYKLVFYEKENIYTLIYFSEWYGKPEYKSSICPNCGGTKEKWIGNKSILMKYEKGRWVAVFDKTNEIMKFVRLFDILSYEAIDLILTNDWQKYPNSEVYKFLIKDAIISGPNNSLYINNIRIFQPATNLYSDIPNEMRNSYGIMGPQDRYRLDDKLKYWLDR